MVRFIIFLPLYFLWLVIKNRILLVFLLKNFYYIYISNNISQFRSHSELCVVWYDSLNLDTENTMVWDPKQQNLESEATLLGWCDAPMCHSVIVHCFLNVGRFKFKIRMQRWNNISVFCFKTEMIFSKIRTTLHVKKNPSR